jgi:hypothetical protein
MRRVLLAAVVLLTAGLFAVLLLPYRDLVFLTDEKGAVELDLPGVVFTAQGVVFFAVLLWTGYPFLTRDPPDRMSLFLTGWLILELGAYFALSPFPAGRRVMGVGVVAAIAFFRAAAATSIRVPLWVMPYATTLGLGLFAVDAWDARPENELAQAAAGYTEDHGGGRVWFSGHWGFQYYCDRAGMVPVVPNASRLEPGDWLVFPIVPDDQGFYRPYHGGAKFRPDPRYLVPEIEFVWRDLLSAQTIPTLYGGRYPVTGRDHPRLRVVVYRVTAAWAPIRIE